MPSAIPNYDLGILITVDILLALIGLVFSGTIYWRISFHLSEATKEIASMQREVAFMIRRQYGDIDRDLQEIKELTVNTAPFGSVPLLDHVRATCLAWMVLSSAVCHV